MLDARGGPAASSLLSGAGKPLQPLPNAQGFMPVAPPAKKDKPKSAKQLATARLQEAIKASNARREARKAAAQSDGAEVARAVARAPTAASASRPSSTAPLAAPDDPNKQRNAAGSHGISYTRFDPPSSSLKPLLSVRWMGALRAQGSDSASSW